MAAPSEYNIEVESILGGLESALARGQPLEKAMTSFRNAGYKEENIKEASRKFQVLHRRRFHELGVDPNKTKPKIQGAVSSYGQQEKNTQEKKVEKQKKLVPVQIREKLIEQYELEKAEMDARSSKKRIQGGTYGKKNNSSEESVSEDYDEDLSSSEAELNKKVEESSSSEKKSKKSRKFRKDKSAKNKDSGSRYSESSPKKNQVVSGYGEDQVAASENFKAAVDEMIKAMSNMNVNPQVVVKQGKERKQKPQVVNKISNYGMKPPTPVNKAVTFLLIFLLILLLGVLAAVFFFREELIDLFNTFTLEYLLPLFLGK